MGMDINQGDVFWIDLGKPRGRALGYKRPCVVVQRDSFNRSKLGTTVICGITSNLKRAHYPGNILLPKKEGNLPKESVVMVSQIHTIDKKLLHDKAGSIKKSNIKQIIKGIHLLTNVDT
jgi:mRNA interferase MazF